MGEGLFIQAGNVGDQGPMNGEFGPDGFVDHGSTVGPDGSVTNAYGDPSGASDAEAVQGGAAEEDGEADDDRLRTVEEDVVTHFEDPNGSITNVVARGARVGGRIIQLGDVQGDGGIHL